jgi:O-antigen ligase
MGGRAPSIEPDLMSWNSPHIGLRPSHAGNWRPAAFSGAFLLGAAAYAGIVGYLALHDRTLAVGAAAIGLLAGIVAEDVARLAVVATAGVWLIERVPGNVSVTDVLVAAAGVAAALSAAGQAIDPRGRTVLRCFSFYLGTLSVTLAFNQNLRSDFELLHRVALVAGAICVGAWLVMSGLERTALRAILMVTTFFATAALAEGLIHGFARPAQPLGYQKNFIGSIVATVLLVLLAAHRRFGLSDRVLRGCALLLLGGLIASHSRGAMVAVCVGALVWFFRGNSRVTPRLRVVVIVAAIAIGIFTAISVVNEMERGTGRHTSLTVRSEVEKQTRDLWIAHPWTGVGLRFFKTPRYAGYQAPNNVIDEIAAEAGVFGVIGFVVFVAGTLVGLGRLSGDLATAGLCVVTGRFVHGLFDIYWTGGTTTLPWIVAGMGLASVAAPALRGRSHMPPLAPA